MTAPGRVYLVAAGVAPLGHDRCVDRQVEGVPNRFGRLVRTLVNHHITHDADRVKRLVEDRQSAGARRFN